ncbi:MAG: threonylcarbamoyl-AMP synthase [Nitrospirae bacterium]|nr:threonylcarbamoyl-AMP synthase [Nitrospirota bacterium]
MKILRVSETGRETALSEASRIISGGGIVAFPTETFYGLGADCRNIHALERLYELKHRPAGRAIPVIIGRRDLLSDLTPGLNDIEEMLVKRFWPGPLTLLVTARKDLPELITADTGRVAVRVPGESFALDLAKALGFPITATSANISGMPAAENAADVIRYFGDALDLVVDGGKTPGELPSTIVEVVSGKIKIVRPGRISEEEMLIPDYS